MGRTPSRLRSRLRRCSRRALSPCSSPPWRRRRPARFRAGSGAWSRRRRRASKNFSASSAAASTASASRSPGARLQPRRNGPFDFSGTDPIDGEAAAARIDVLPFLLRRASMGGADRGRARHGRGLSSDAASYLCATASSARAGAGSSSRPSALRPAAGSFWAEHPERSEAPDPRLADLERAELQVLRRPPQPGRVRQAGEALLQRPQGGRSGRADRPRRALLQPGRSADQARAAAGLHGAGIPPDHVQAHAGDQARLRQGVALHPYTGNYKRLTPYIEEVRRVLKANHDAGKGLWITELGWSSEPRRTERDGFAKGLRGQAAQLKGAFRLLRARQRRWHIHGVYWFSVDDSPRQLQLLRRLGAVRRRLPAEARLARLRALRGRPSRRPLGERYFGFGRRLIPVR